MKKFSDIKHRNTLHNLLLVGLDLTNYSNKSSNIITKETPYHNEIYSITSYNDSVIEDFIDSNNLFLLLHINIKTNSTCQYKVDIYADSFSIMPGDIRYLDEPSEFFIHVPSLEQFLPFTEESLFQMNVLYDLQDLTKDEITVILEISNRIRNKNV